MQAQGRQPTVATLGLAAQGLGTCVIVHLPVHAIGKEVLDGHPQQAADGQAQLAEAAAAGKDHRRESRGPEWQHSHRCLCPGKGLETARVELGEQQRGRGRRQQQHRGSAMQGGGAADCSSEFLASAQLARACNRAPTRACPPDQVDSNAACLQLLDKIFGPLHGWVAQVGLAKRSPLLTVHCRTCTCKDWHPSAGQAAGPTGVRRLSGG